VQVVAGWVGRAGQDGVHPADLVHGEAGQRLVAAGGRVVTVAPGRATARPHQSAVSRIFESLPGPDTVVPPRSARSYLVVLVERQAVLVRNRRPQRGEGLLVRRSLVIRRRGGLVAGIGLVVGAASVRDLVLIATAVPEASCRASTTSPNPPEPSTFTWV